MSLGLFPFCLRQQRTPDGLGIGARQDVRAETLELLPIAGIDELIPFRRRSDCYARIGAPGAFLRVLFIHEKGRARYGRIF